MLGDGLGLGLDGLGLGLVLDGLGVGLELDGLGLGLGLVLDGLGVGLVLFDGELVGLVGLVVGELDVWLADGCGLGEVVELDGLGLAELADAAGRSAAARRIAALGLLEQAAFTAFTVGAATSAGRATEAAKTSGLAPRSRKPVSAPRVSGLTSCALTGTTSSLTSEPV